MLPARLIEPLRAAEPDLRSGTRAARTGVLPGGDALEVAVRR